MIEDGTGGTGGNFGPDRAGGLVPGAETDAPTVGPFTVWYETYRVGRAQQEGRRFRDSPDIRPTGARVVLPSAAAAAERRNGDPFRGPGVGIGNAVATRAGDD